MAPSVAPKRRCPAPQATGSGPEVEGRLWVGDRRTELGDLPSRLWVTFATGTRSTCHAGSVSVASTTGCSSLARMSWTSSRNVPPVSSARRSKKPNTWSRPLSQLLNYVRFSPTSVTSLEALFPQRPADLGVQLLHDYGCRLHLPGCGRQLHVAPGRGCTLQLSVVRSVGANSLIDFGGQAGVATASPLTPRSRRAQS